MWCHQTLQQIHFRLVVFSFIFRNHAELMVRSKKEKYKIRIASGWFNFFFPLVDVVSAFFPSFCWLYYFSGLLLPNIEQFHFSVLLMCSFQRLKKTNSNTQKQKPGETWQFFVLALPLLPLMVMTLLLQRLPFWPKMLSLRPKTLHTFRYTIHVCTENAMFKQYNLNFMCEISNNRN